MAMLTPEEARRIARAVEEAEKGTGGEIVTAIIPESDDYAGRELVFSIVIGLIAYVLLTVFTLPFGTLLDSLFWTQSPMLLPLSTMAITLLAGAAAYAAAQIPAVDRIIVGKKTMAESVRRRAMRHFVESAAYDTIDRTGVLLFISVLERRVELVADKGINDQVDPGIWEGIVEALIAGVKVKKTAEAVESAVNQIGAVLAERVPPRPDDANEIADGPTELGKGS